MKIKRAKAVEGFGIAKGKYLVLVWCSRDNMATGALDKNYETMQEAEAAATKCIGTEFYE